MLFCSDFTKGDRASALLACGLVLWVAVMVVLLSCSPLRPESKNPTSCPNHTQPLTPDLFYLLCLWPKWNQCRHVQDDQTWQFWHGPRIISQLYSEPQSAIIVSIFDVLLLSVKAESISSYFLASASCNFWLEMLSSIIF